MRNLLKMFCVSVTGLGLFAGPVRAVDSAAGRGAYNVNQTNRAGATTQRMPTMPTLPISAVGNISTTVPTTGGGSPMKPADPDTPNPPATECADGGVRNSDYTVEACMNDILACINNGALPGGLNDLFNEDLRNAIFNGMGLCTVQVEHCVSTVRKDCAPVYRSRTDVWLDFNARKIQPEYFSFVLRKTGLTPNQAENTCMLLDKNAYGASFTAVSNSGTVTAEYNNRVGAYNSQQGGVLIKANPQGPQVNVNNPGVDGQRGHYARWDATTAECYIRVAAYNKDKQISHSWLFGAVGDDRPAEVWRVAGDTFTCNKDLFGFSLMNQTATAAVIGIGGGAVLGASVGAIVGHGAREFDCNEESQRKEILRRLQSGNNVAILNEFLEDDEQISASGDKFTVAQCQKIVDLFNLRQQLLTALLECDSAKYTRDELLLVLKDVLAVYGTCEEPNLDPCFDLSPFTKEQCHGMTTYQQCADKLLSTNDAVVNYKNKVEKEGHCKFKPINNAKVNGTSIYCEADGNDCVDAYTIKQDLKRMGNVLDTISDVMKGEKSNMGKSIGIGAATGIGAGGLATLITAGIEHSNINCRVGDNLAQVGLNKSYSIGSLKDFYVKWDLHLPDTISPTAAVNDCKSWQNMCATYTDLNQCARAQFNYRPDGATKTTSVSSACIPSGSVCIENYPVAKSYGACK